MTSVIATVKAKSTITATTNSVTVGGVVTEQINGVTIGTVAAGATNNQVITDTASAAIGTAANPSVIADGSITSSLGSFTDSVVAEGTYTIANVSWTDSDLAPQTTEYGQPIVCSLPSPTSLSVTAYSDAGHTTPITTLDIGATVYLKAVPIGFTPDNYIFYAFDGVNIYPIVEQASAEYTWTVDIMATGASSIYVSGEDTVGGASAWNNVDVTINSNFLLDTTYGTTSLFTWFPYRVKANYTSPVAIIRRASDNMQKTFFFDSVGELSASSENSFGESISTFCSGTTGYLVRGYSQEDDGKYFEASSTVDQAVIFEAGAMVDLNGQTAIRSVKTQIYTLSETITFRSAFVVVKVDTKTNYQWVLGASGIGAAIGSQNAGLPIVAYDGTTVVQGTTNDTDVHIATFLLQQGIWVDGVSEATGSMTDIPITSILGRTDNANFGVTGRLSGFVLYADDRNTQRSSIETNINGNYTPSIL